jgi:hypothetical protein
MKKYILMLMLLFFPCTLIASTPVKVISDFSSSWLYQYDASDYDLTIHPYFVDEPNIVGEMGVLWDLDSDGIVNLHDFSVLSQIDMTQLVKDTKGLQGAFTKEYMQTSLSSIMDKEKELEITDMRLFKILLYESGFEVNVYNYSVDFFGDIDLDLILFWEDETRYGTIDIRFNFEYLFEIPIGYSYEYTYKYYLKGD